MDILIGIIIVVFLLVLLFRSNIQVLKGLVFFVVLVVGIFFISIWLLLHAPIVLLLAIVGLIIWWRLK